MSINPVFPRNVTCHSVEEVSLTTRVCRTAKLITTPSGGHCAPAATNPSPGAASRPCTESFTQNILSVRSAWPSLTRAHLRSRTTSRTATHVLSSCLVDSRESVTAAFTAVVDVMRIYIACYHKYATCWMTDIPADCLQNLFLEECHIMPDCVLLPCEKNSRMAFIAYGIIYAALIPVYSIANGVPCEMCWSQNSCWKTST